MCNMCNLFKSCWCVLLCLCFYAIISTMEEVICAQHFSPRQLSPYGDNKEYSIELYHIVSLGSILHLML